MGTPPHFTQPNFPNALVRYGHTSSLVKNCTYVFGGRNSKGELVGNLLAQDLKALTWTIVDDAHGFTPCAREFHTSAVYNGQVFVFGGRNAEGESLNDMFMYDPEENSWTEVACGGMIPPAVHSHTFTAYNDTLLLIGGIYSTDAAAERKQAGLDLLVRSEEGDEVKSSREVLSAVHTRHLEEKDEVETMPMYSFNVTNYEWSIIPTADDQPLARSGHTTVMMGSKLLVFGGKGEYGMLNDCHVYEDSKWSAPEFLGAVPHGRAHHTTVVVGESMYVFGGTNGRECFQDLHVLHMHTNDKYAWTRIVTTGRIPKARAYHSVVVYYSLMILFGGASGASLGKTLRKPNAPVVPFVDEDTPFGAVHSDTVILDLRNAPVTAANMEVKDMYCLDDFEILTTLGTGTFGRVSLAKHRETNRYMALKTLKKKKILFLKQVEHVMNEKEILSRIDNPFIVNMLGSFKNNHSLYIAMEFIQGGEFFSHLRKVRRFGDQTAQFYAAQVVLTFEYLHNLNIVYRDLKPENLLIDRNGYLKMTDFGFAKIVQFRTWTLCGTPEYIAPEIILSTGHGKPVDWWALGILIFEMLTGSPPFQDSSPMAIYTKMLQGEFTYPSYLSKTVINLIDQLLESDITLRIGNLVNGATDVKNHKWFSGIDFDSVMNQTLRAPWIPTLRAEHDTRHFDKYADNEKRASSVHLDPDPFANF